MSAHKFPILFFVIAVTLIFLGTDAARHADNPLDIFIACVALVAGLVATLVGYLLTKAGK